MIALNERIRLALLNRAGQSLYAPLNPKTSMPGTVS